MKIIILIIGTLLIALNTLIWLIVDYATLNFLLANLGIALSMGLLYFVAYSKMADGYKIGLTILLFFTGIVRCLCVVFAKQVWENNYYLIVTIGILLLELICLASAMLGSKKSITPQNVRETHDKQIVTKKFVKNNY